MPLKVEEREAIVERQNLQFDSGEWKGACPRCGGSDRFNVTRDGLVWCRGCGNEPGFYQAVMQAVDEATKGKRVPYAPPIVTANGNGRFSPIPSKTKRMASTLWHDSEAADDSPAHVYLSEHRNVWPPADVGVPLPSSVRWVSVDAMRNTGCKDIPDWASGAMLCRYEDGEGNGTAVTLEALDANGHRRNGDERWRRTYGSRMNSSFVAQSPSADAPSRAESVDAFKVGIAGGCDAIVISEGEVTALACALQRPGSKVLAAGGTANMVRAADMAAEAATGDTKVIVEADGDDPGRKAASRILQAHPCVLVHESPEGQDAADVLQAEVIAEIEKVGDVSDAWRSVLDRHEQEHAAERRAPVHESAHPSQGFGR